MLWFPFCGVTIFLLARLIIQDNFQAGYMATKHLVEQGYRKFVFLAGPMNSPTIRRRLDGFRAALESSYIPVEEDMIHPGEMGIERGEEEAPAICRMARSEPVGVVASNEERMTCHPPCIVVVARNGDIPECGLVTCRTTHQRANLDAFGQKNAIDLIHRQVTA